jgi:hypothetical protein
MATLYAFLQSIADHLPDGIPTAEELDRIVDALSPVSAEQLEIEHLVMIGFDQMVRIGAAARFRDASGMFRYQMLREKTAADDAEVDAAFKREHERTAEEKATRMIELMVEMGVYEQYLDERGESVIRGLHKMTDAEGEFFNDTLEREDKRNATRDALLYLLTITGAVVDAAVEDLAGPLVTARPSHAEGEITTMLTDHAVGLLKHSIATIPHNERGAFLQHDLVEKMAEYLPAWMPDEHQDDPDVWLRVAVKLVETAMEKGGTHATGMLHFPHHDPEPYYPDQLMSDGKGYLIQQANMTLDFMKDHVELSTLKAKIAEAELAEARAWLAQEEARTASASTN